MEIYLGLHALEGEWHALLPRYLLVAGYLRDKKVLEIGCGAGLGTAVLHELGGVDVVAIDHRPELVQSAEVQFASLSAHFRMMFYEEMDFEDDSFDVVLCLDADFPVDDGALLKEVRRVLRPGGTFVGAWAEPGTYGMENVLPRLGDSVQSRTMESARTFEQAMGGLSRVFSEVRCFEQVPELGFLFRPSLKAPRAASATEDLENTSEFDVDAARKEKKEADELQMNIATPSEAEVEQLLVASASAVDRSLLMRGESRMSSFELALCSDVPEGCSLFEVRSGVRIRLPYFAVAARLGRILNDLYRYIDDVSQANLMLESQLEEKSRLIDDLEEEARSHRELSRDQASQLEALLGERSASGSDLRAHYAQLPESDNELRAEFTRRLDDAQRLVQERNDYIDHLADAMKRWERYASSLQRDLDARDLALENLNRVLERRDVELAAAQGSSNLGPPGTSSWSEGISRPPDENLALLAHAEREAEVREAELGELRRKLGESERQLAATRDQRRLLRAELEERDKANTALVSKLADQDRTIEDLSADIVKISRDFEGIRLSVEGEGGSDERNTEDEHQPEQGQDHPG